VTPELIRSTIQELTADMEPMAVKIGMLGSREVAKAVSEYIERSHPPNIVLDPVLRSSSGAGLLNAEGLAVLLSRLLPLADVVTPNLEEAAAMTGLGVATLPEMKQAAARLLELGAKGVVVKGGHLTGEEAVEFLSFREGDAIRQREFPGPRLDARATHGTGCAFSSSLACHLALGKKLTEAVALAKQYVAAAMQSAPDLGTGAGPLHHLFRIK